jgi:hypothetical protein
MPTTITHPDTVSALADIVTAYHDAHETRTPSRATYDAVARALGVGIECTGNPDTAAESVTHTPKAGLSVAFYSVGPTHRSEGTDNPMTAYYVATWRGDIVRGHIKLSTRGYHADTPRGFVCFDQCAYMEPLPVGCRRLVVELVEAAVIASNVSPDEMRAEWSAAATYYDIQSYLYRAKVALEDAARVEMRGH